MRSRSRNLLLVIASMFFGGVAHAEELDIAAFEYVDVVETVEGSIWKGVVTEQAPNVFYKIETADGSVHVIKAYDVVKVTKQRNPKFRARAKRPEPAPGSWADLAGDREARVIDASEERAETDTMIKDAFRPRNGVRLEPEIAIVVPGGDLVNIGGSALSYRTSFAPGARIGYELFRNNIGISFGGLARYTSWRLPAEVASLGSHWTLETQAYGRAALHMGRAAPYAGLALGVDTNHTFNNMSGISSTAIAFGMNLSGGVTFAATPATMLEVGADYHPGTDTIESGVDASISYFALRFGAAFRF